MTFLHTLAAHRSGAVAAGRLSLWTGLVVAVPVYLILCFLGGL